jgi:hypothetical protein
MGEGNDRRKHRRIAFVSPVSMSWTAGGNKVQARGTAIDLSTYGMFVECDVSIALDTLVTVEVPSYSFKGKATVARCLPTGKKFRVGLHFDAVILFYVDVRRELTGRSARSIAFSS